MYHLAAALPALLQGGRAINGKDSAVFWWLLYVMVRFSRSVIHTMSSSYCSHAAKLLGMCWCLIRLANRCWEHVLCSLWLGWQWASLLSSASKSVSAVQEV